MVNKQIVIVLAMHGVPPADFPKRELDEFFVLHAGFEHAATAEGPGYERYEELQTKLKHWPRSEDNDPYHAASYELARD